MPGDISTIANYTVQIKALQDAANAATDPTTKAVLNSQVAVISAQLAAEAAHQQSVADSSATLLNGLGLFQTLTQAVGGAAPSIIGLFAKK